MKKYLLELMGCLFLVLQSQGQVTQINSNKSLNGVFPLNNTTTLFVSAIDETLWASDGTLAGTIQLSDTIKVEGGGSLLNGKFIFSGTSPNSGTEIFITDGTPAGTKILKDIIPGVNGSEPDPAMAILNGILYFTDSTAAAGRELWKTDGTPANTMLAVDIVPGPVSSITKDDNELISNASFLLLNVRTAAQGNELWRSGGSAANTFLIKDINTGTPSSNPNKFFPFSNMILFAATDATHGEEIWKTDGTSAGTLLIKDIYPGPDSSTYIPIINGGFKIPFPMFLGFHSFKDHLYFMANDGVNGTAIWVTQGSAANTSFVKVINTDTLFSSFILFDAINLPGKFIFPVTNGKDRFELWQSDGSTAGTILFKSFPATPTSSIPLIYLNFGYDAVTQQLTSPLYNGNFFFSAHGTEGRELWISDGSLPGTKIVKDINPGTADGLVRESYIYTTAGLYFAATDGVHGNELWKTNGTSAGTSMVQDINPNANDADPLLMFINNSHLFFGATDGNDPDHTDLFVVNGTFRVLPIQLLNFTVIQKSNDAVLQWSTSQEINSKDFTVQSTSDYDATEWENIGTVTAAGNSSVRKNYSFTDIGVINSGRDIVYYRLVMKDIDGKTEMSDIVVLKIKNADHWDVQLLSNPVKDNVKILVTGVKGRANLSINDINGKILYKMQIQNQNGQILIPVILQKGIYLLSVNNDNERKTIKFIKE